MKLKKLAGYPLKATCMLLLGGSLLTSCSKNDSDSSSMRPDVVFYGLTDNNQILRYNARTAETAEAGITLTGLPAGEKLLSIDFRPATGQLYALGSTSRLYVINLKNGSTMAVGTGSFSPALSGTTANIDFNPTVDRVRLVSNTGQNLRLHPETGGVAGTDGNINGGSNPSITSIAYTNSFSGASATDLFDIDVNTKKLYKQTPPNNGVLVEVGTINVDFSGKGGFDINADNSVALATFTVNGRNKLYSLNTSNASATFLADLSVNLVDIAIPTPAVAYAVSEAGALQIFNPLSTAAPVSKTFTLGLGETLMGLDFRPATGQLYGIGVTTLGAARLYTFNLGTGEATAVGSGFNLTAGTSAVGFDFNPTVDLIRLVTPAGQNLRLSPVTGAVTGTDKNLNPGSPAINGAAYTNNFVGGGTTELFVMDLGKLYKQNPPNDGVLTEVGSLGVNADAQNGFDIGGQSNMGYAILTVGTTTKVYTINTSTGAATAGRDFPNKVRGMTVGLGF